MTDNSIVVPFQTKDEEHTRRVMVEARRLANLAPGEYRIWSRRSAEQLGIERADLEELVLDLIKDREKKQRDAKAEERRQEQRIERQRASAERKDERKREREQRAIDKEAARKFKDKQKAFAALLKLPSDQQDARLTELAKSLAEDGAALREEFEEFSASERIVMPSSEWLIETWPEPVATADLLVALIAKISKHIVARPHEILAIALWVMMSWVHEIATHSVYLIATSAEPDSGKTTLLGVLRFLTAKPFLGAESTGPSIYRFVDREKPTLIIDEADDLFKRKSDIKHILNAAWTRGTKIPRQVTVQGVSMTV
jgi:hypothetical protein